MSAARPVRWLLLAAAVWCAAATLRNTFFAAGTLDFVFGVWPTNAVLLLAAGLILARAVARREERAAWLLIGSGALSWLGGNLYFATALADAETIPIPSPADIGYLLFAPLMAVGCVLLIRSRSAGIRADQWFDGAAAAMAIAAVTAAIVFDPVAGAAEGSLAEVATSLAYPIADIILLATCTGALASRGWDLDRTWLAIGLGLVAFAIADSLYLVQTINETYVLGAWYEPGWNIGFMGVAYAAWARPAEAAGDADDRLRRVVMPLVFAVVALGLLAYGSFVDLNPLAVTLATVAIVALLGRLLITFRENVSMLRTSRTEAVTDQLTGLRNRRGLLRDLEARMAGGAACVLVLFDLDGFKNYNDSFGHPAGDALLARLGCRLVEHLGPTGEAYRMGGDEFCVLFDRSPGFDPDAAASAAATALSESGEGFRVGCSYGYAVVPEDAAEPVEAMRMADHGLYAMKNSGRQSAEHQSRNVLLEALTARSPALEAHLTGVAELTEATAAELGLAGEELAQVRHAAELHDIGKVGIPDALLDKPGDLDEAEWEFIRRHTVIGERIIAAAPSLRPVAKLVRASHERWEGGGYPDGIAGEEIPLGARIIAVADAYDAIVTDRPYRPARTPEEALAELRRCAGTQFDPAVVEAFCRVAVGAAHVR